MNTHHHRIAAATYLVFFLPRILGEREDQLLRYHMKQALGLLIVALALQGAMTIVLYWFPSFYNLRLLMVWAIRAFLIYEVAVGMQGALRGEQKPLPYIGSRAERL